jgi:hypothetical protein
VAGEALVPASSGVLVTLPITKRKVIGDKLTLLHSRVCDLVECEVVFENNFVDLGYSVSVELVGSDIDFDNVLVTLKGVLKGSGIALLDLVAAHIQAFNTLVGFKELCQGLTEHVSELVGRKAKRLKARVIVK